MNRFAAVLVWRKSLALAAGALAATGFQPLALWPVTLAAIALLIHLVATSPDWKRALLLGWLFGVGHFTIGNNWIATAFTYQAEMPAWLGWIAVFLLSLYLAVYPGLAALGAWLVARRRPAGLVPAFAACWIVSEWLRSWVFTGFAWNPLGMVTLGGFSRPGLALIAPWVGTYALSGLVVLLAGAWLAAVARRQLDWPGAALALGPVVLFVIPSLVPVPAATTSPKALPFTLVQPDTRQEDLNDPSKFEEQFQVTAALTRARRPGERRLVLWPESGIPDYLREGYPQLYYDSTTYAGSPVLARQRIARVIGKGSLLLTGAVDLEIRGGRAASADNTVSAVDEHGRLLRGYAKAHLVPYGEYLPLKGLLEPLGLTRLVAGTIEFRPGPGPRTIDYGPWGKVGFQICYEIIFSGQVVDPEQRPNMIFNPSNDGWFGSWGPPQHLAQARMRAIEEGLPVLRATTTGISAVIDADGVVRQHLPLKARGRLDGTVPLPHAPTLFSRTGNMLALAWAAVLLALSMVVRRRGRG